MAIFISEIFYSFDELELRKDNVYSIVYLKFWVFKYANLYKEVKSQHIRFCYRCTELINEGLPSNCICSPHYCHKFNIDYKFLNLYDNLAEIVTIYNEEKNYLNALELYSTLKSNLDIKDWLIKHFGIWDVSLSKLMLLNFDIDDDEIEITHLQVNTKLTIDFKIYVSKGNFEKINEFKDLYDELYYMKKLYPEKLEEEQH